jgi:hypothetical protein
MFRYRGKRFSVVYEPNPLLRIDFHAGKSKKKKKKIVSVGIPIYRTWDLAFE